MNPAIQVHKLTKIYRTYQKEAGFWGALKGLAHRRYKETAAAQERQLSGARKASWSASSARTARARRPC